MDNEYSPLSISGRLPARFERRVLVLPPGSSLDYEAAVWRGALVVIEEGGIELELPNGGCHVFGEGNLLWLDSLPLRALHNRGAAPAVLVVVSRRDTSAGG